MNIYEKLNAIKCALKAPKNQVNKFGGYNYRSCEDILEALKPYEKTYSVVVTLNDTLECIGNRYYIKATASITDFEGQSISVNAYAREEETKKGMDASQITGSASSYARKYALNGLFGIDDTKDADATNTHGYATPTCECCGNVIKSVTDKNGNHITAVDLANRSKEKYGKVMCITCAKANG